MTDTVTTEAMTEDRLREILASATAAAKTAAERFFNDTMGGEDRGCCGFAWVNVYEYQGEKITGNTKLGRMLKRLGVDQDHRRVFWIWNPSGFGCQNIDTLEKGAQAYAKTLQAYGFKAYANSRMD